MTIAADQTIRTVAERVKAAEAAHRLAHPGPEPGNYDPEDGRNAYVLIPPIPNITGGLHIGHAVSFVIQDTLARRARGRGRNVLFPVGTDHAGLTGQVVAERRLAEQGRSRHDLGREGFAQYMNAWAREHTDLVIKQSASLGVAADWDRRVSTLDDVHSRETARAFRTLARTGLVYRARAITSWCVQCESCVSVAEIRRDERHLDVHRFSAYTTTGLRLEIATLSPEVIVGAVAVGVPADHPQAAELCGANVELPLTGRIVPVIDVPKIEEPLERTARLIVPAYNAADLDLAAEEGLAVPEIFDTRGRIISADPRWNGRTGPACREVMLTELAELSLLLTGGTILRGLALHGLCGSSVIPRLCSQWYLRAEALYDETLAGLNDPELRFNLEKWRARCEDWVHATIGEASKAPRWWEGACLALVQGHDSNRDWILSRQNWWGQQIPAWECARCGSGGALDEGVVQALVVDELLGHARLAAGGQIGGRGADDEAVGGELAGVERRVGEPADPDDHVEPTADHVDEAVVGREVHVDPGVLVEERGEDARQVHLGEGDRRVHAQRPADVPGRALPGLGGGGAGGHEGGAVLVDLQPLLGDGEGARRALQEPHAEGVL